MYDAEQADTAWAPAAAVPARIATYLATHEVPCPCLVVDTEMVVSNYAAMTAALPGTAIYYAVKANPASALLLQLAVAGSNFDVASRGEIELCLSLGIPAERLSFGNTIKKASDIAFAHSVGVGLFAVDMLHFKLRLTDVLSAGDASPDPFLFAAGQRICWHCTQKKRGVGSATPQTLDT